jgi:hypothetical protein
VPPVMLEAEAPPYTDELRLPREVAVPGGGCDAGSGVVVVLETEPACTRGVRSWRGMSLLVVGEQMGEEGKTPELEPGWRWCVCGL